MTHIPRTDIHWNVPLFMFFAVSIGLWAMLIIGFVLIFKEL
jgi:hypothetical protein